MYCHFETCIATLKYVLPLRNMYYHSEICITTPKYVIQAACTRSQTITERVDVHYRPTNVQVTGSPSLYRPHTVLLPSAAVHPRTAKVLSMLKIPRLLPGMDRRRQTVRERYKDGEPVTRLWGEGGLTFSHDGER